MGYAEIASTRPDLKKGSLNHRTPIGLPELPKTALACRSTSLKGGWFLPVMKITDLSLYWFVPRSDIK